MKKLTAIFMAVILTVAFTACTGRSKAEDNLIIGVDDTFAPMGFRDDKGELVGFDIDLATEVAKRAGFAIEFQVIDWSMKEAELKGGNIDLIWNGYSITDARKEKVNFTQSYLENKQIIVTMAASTIATKKDLAGKVVTVQKESSALDAVMAATEIAASLKGGEPIQLDTNNDAFMDLESGRTDAIVVDEVLARYYIKLRGQANYKILEEDFGNEEYAIGVRKTDTELLDKIDKTLTAMRNDGSFDQINSKWFTN